MLFYKDKYFIPRLLALAAPILLQNLLSSSLNFIDVFMVGRLGETALAAVGSANQFFFVFNMLNFGLASGSAIFTAQHWGQKDVKSIRGVMGFGLLLTLGIALIFTVATFLSPDLVIRLFSKDATVIQMGSDYLKIISLTFILTAISISYSVVLRSTENVIYPMVASFVGVITNTVLNYLLIFGHFGFPKMGVSGAAIATLIARFAEMSIIVSITYLRKLPAAVKFADLFSFTRDQATVYIKKALPVVLQAVGWSAGFSMFSIIYGHISTESLAAFSVSGSIERICLIFFTGIGASCSIMVGNRIGAGEEAVARGYAKNFLLLNIGVAIVVSTALFFLRTPIVSIYKLTDTSREYMLGILLVMSLIMWAKSTNIIFHMGILKAGGDTLFSMIVDVGGVWLIGVPIALFAGFVLKLPVNLIVACVTVEEITKMLVAFKRYRSGRWLNRLVEATAAKED
jgi:putative MATE family efflux protein